MADPTLGELAQQIADLRELITTTYEPPSGDEFSYPIVGQPMNDEMWQWVTKGFGDGVLDLGDIPYGLSSFSNVTNTAMLTVGKRMKTANSVVAGFYHQMSADIPVSLPAVTTTTTYHVCVSYDPLGHSTPAGPVSVQTFHGPPPTTLGRRHNVLHKVTRHPNELLTDATVERVRQRIAPTLVFGSHDQLPELGADDAPVLWGTIAFIHGLRKDILIAKGDGDEGVTRWESLISPPWIDLALSSGYKELNVGGRPQYRLVGDMLEFRGQVQRTNGGIFTPRDYIKFGRISGPAYCRATFSPAVGSSARSAFIAGTSDGRDMSFYLNETGATWLSIDGRIPARFE